MPRPMQAIGDPNNGGGFAVSGYPKCINGGRPTACIGDIVSPHDRKPVHFAVVATGNGTNMSFAEGSIVLDPWRKTPDIEGVTVIHYGNTRNKDT